MTSWLDRDGRDGVPLDGAPTREQQFTELYREHYPFVLRFALRRLRALEAAQDATVATFAVVWARFDEVPQVPRAWIYRIARSVVSLELRQRMREERAPHAPGTARLRVTQHELEDDPVLRALSDLRDDDREVLQLRAWEDLTGAEIGEVLGCSSNDAAVRLHEAQQRLRELLGMHAHHDGADSAGAATDAAEPDAAGLDAAGLDGAGLDGADPEGSAEPHGSAERRAIPRRTSAVPSTKARRSRTVNRRVPR